MRLLLFTAALLVLGCHLSQRGACSTVPGYLDFDNLPDTNFSCEGKVIGGYYADVETGCQMFHVCTIGQKGEITDIKFLCLNGTVFDQETRVCERVDEVDCSKTEGFYGLNLELYGNTGATYGLEEPEESENPEESHSPHSQAQSSSPPSSTPPSPSTAPKSTITTTTPSSVDSTTSAPSPPTTAAHPFTPPTTISSLSSTLHSFTQKPHTIHFSSTSSPHSVSSSFLTFTSGGEHLFESAPEGSGAHGPDLEHYHPPPPPPPSSSSSWPQVNLQSGGGSGIIHQTDSSPFHALKNSPKPVNLFGAGGNSNGHSNHQFIFSTTKSPSHFFPSKSPGGFSVTSHSPVTQFPLKKTGQLQTSAPTDFFHSSQNTNSPKISQSFSGHHTNVQIVPNPVHFQYSGRPSHQHQVFTTPSVQSTVVSSTSSVTSVKTTIKHQDDNHDAQNPPATVNTFAFGINSGLSSTFVEEKSLHNDSKQNPTPPTSYDEYHERDVALDPFFKDVPRISLKQGRSKRRKRQTPDNIKPFRGSSRFKNLQNSQHTNEQETPDNVRIRNETRKRTRQHSHQSLASRSRQNGFLTTPKPNTDSSQEPNLHISTTEISSRLSSVHKTLSRPQALQSSSFSDSTMQESQIQQSKSKDHRNNAVQQMEKSSNESTSEQPTTTREPLPETNFKCDGKVIGGYYADPETDCQLFHICVLGRHGKIRDDKFLCGPGTVFDQKSRTCQAKHLVNCKLSTSLYNVNLPYHFPEESEPVPDLMFESHKISKRATRKGALHSEESADHSLDNIPQTDFSCGDKAQEGLYADIGTDCKYFHLCQKNKKGDLQLVSTFVCPPGTSFNQPEGNCDASKEIDCAIYSQPEHIFSKSHSRNKRDTLHELSNLKVKFKLAYFVSHHKHNGNKYARETNFTCSDKPEEGMYADLETDCKYFHLCLKNKSGNLHLVSSFMCPSGTSFNQHQGNCVTAEQIVCLNYSQPEHNIYRFKHRIRRNILEDLKNVNVKYEIAHFLSRHKRVTDGDGKKTNFSCGDKFQEGLYADTKTECKYFHLCQKGKSGNLHLVSTFECPAGTSFNQYEGNCDTSTEIDCEIYSQPEHKFAKSKVRNKRNVLNEEGKGGAQLKLSKSKDEQIHIQDEDSKEIYYSDDEIQSTEKYESDTSYDTFSQEVYSSFEDTRTEKSEELNKKDEKLKAIGPQDVNGSSLKVSSVDSDISSNESKETETEEDEEFEREDSSNEKKENSNEKKENSNETKEIYYSENNSKSEHPHNVIKEYKQTESNEEIISKSKTVLTDNTRAIEHIQSSSGTEDKTVAGDEKEIPYHQTSKFREENSKILTLQESDNFNKSVPVGIVEKSSSNEHKYSESMKKLENIENDDFLPVDEADETSTENTREYSTSLEKTFDPEEINTQFASKKSHFIQNPNLTAHVNENLSIENSEERDDKKSEAHKQYDNESLFPGKEEHQKTGDTFQSKVNKLLMKLNASVDDIQIPQLQSTNLNVTNNDYYDYYTDDESLSDLELEEPVDDSERSKQNDSSGETKISKIQPREELMENETPIITTIRQDFTLVDENLENLGSSTPSPKHSTPPSITISNFPLHNTEETTYETEGDFSTSYIALPEEQRTTTEKYFISTTNKLNEINETKLEKSKSETGNVVSSTGVASETPISPDADQLGISTEYEGKVADVSTSSKPELVTNFPVIYTTQEQIDSSTQKHFHDGTSDTLNNSMHQTDKFATNSSKVVTDSLENIDSTTEIFWTTLAPDTSTQTSTVIPSTTSKLLHPYKSRPVYRTWRTTTPPPPVSIRPNSSLRMPRPNIRRGTNKGDQTTESNTKNNEEKERNKTDKDKSNASSEKSENRLETVNKHSSGVTKGNKMTETISKLTMEGWSSTIASIRQDNEPLPISPLSEVTTIESIHSTDPDRTTPSSVLPTFSRKNFFIEREDHKSNTPLLSSTYPSTSKAELLPVLDISSGTEIPLDNSYHFTSVEAQTPQSLDDLYEDTMSEIFSCSGKELHQYIPDPLDCHLFHYCSLGFHNRQLLDFKFMCDKGTTFNPITHRCENEDESLCRNKHS